MPLNPDQNPSTFTTDSSEKTADAGELLDSITEGLLEKKAKEDDA